MDVSLQIQSPEMENIEIVSNISSPCEETEIESETEFQVKPPLEARFKCNTAKEIIHSVLHDILSGQIYDSSLVSTWINQILSSVKAITDRRYKLAINAVLGEQSNGGVDVNCRCLWDCESDAFVSNFFENDTIFCVLSVFAIYCY